MLFKTVVRYDYEIHKLFFLGNPAPAEVVVPRYIKPNTAARKDNLSGISRNDQLIRLDNFCLNGRRNLVTPRARPGINSTTIYQRFTISGSQNDAARTART